MRQRSLDNLLPKSQDVYKYSFGFNYGSGEAPKELVDYIHTRFEVWNICSEECGNSGIRHLQCYGETLQPLVKSERQMFQGKGRYVKYLSTDVKKRYWIAESRSDRMSNIMYVLKDVKNNKSEERTLMLNPHIDMDTLLELIDESCKKYYESGSAPQLEKKPRTYEEKLIFWYTDLPVNERPIQVVPLIQKMLECNLVPWNNLRESQLVNSAEFLLLRCTTGDARQIVIRDKVERCEIYYRSKF